MIEQPQMPAMPSQHVQAYKDATDNLMFLKREQVQITYYTWLLLASLYILAQQATEDAKAFLQAGCVVVCAYAVIMLWDMHGSMSGFRKRLRHIYSTYFSPDERGQLCLDARDHYMFVLILTLVCLVASGFTIYMIGALPSR